MGHRSGSVILGLTVAVLLGGPAAAASRQNRVGAFLVFPLIETSAAPSATVETFLTITNASTMPVVAHVSFINGDSASPQYCFECTFDVPLPASGVATLAAGAGGGVVTFRDIQTGAARNCGGQRGFATVSLEDGNHQTLTDNILLGDEIVVDYTNGSALSLDAIPMSGLTGGNGDRMFAFDGIEYEKLPSSLATNFRAPDVSGPLDATLVLFTLGFQRQFPPATDCVVTGYDASGNLFSSSLQFGCWTRIRLGDLDPGFAYPNLGSPSGFHEHGWLEASCTVQGTGGTGDIEGGVHGAITQSAPLGSVLRRNDPGPALPNADAWGRLLIQSQTDGGTVILTLGAAQ